MTRLRDVTLHAVILGAAAFVMALAFPRTNWSFTPWLALAPLLAIATMRTPRTAFLWGWASGTVFFLVLLRWLQYTFQVYSAIPWPLVYGPVFLLAAYCGFWTGAVAWAVSWLTARRSAALALGLAPFLWVAAEWLRGHLFGGFPWGALGYSQYLHLRVIQIAELAGVHAVSFVLLAVNAALAGCVVLRWRHALVGTGVAAALLAATVVFGTVRVAEPLPGETVSRRDHPALDRAAAQVGATPHARDAGRLLRAAGACRRAASRPDRLAGNGGADAPPARPTVDRALPHRRGRSRRADARRQHRRRRRPSALPQHRVPRHRSGDRGPI